MATIRRTHRLLLTAALAGLTVGAVASDPANTAHDTLPPVAPSIHPELEAHTAHFERKIHPVGERVHVAVGWNLANTAMIVGDDGVIIIDVGEDAGRTREVAREFRKITDKPVRAIVYTHFHPDHINGAGAFTTAEAVADGEVEIFAHESFEDHVTGQGATLGPILSMRSAYSFGAALPPHDHEGVNAGLGPLVVNIDGEAAPSEYIAPSQTFSNELEVEIAGVRLRMMHIPGETDDQIGVYLPDDGVVFSGDTFQGPTLPNIHTLRGTRFRDPMQWVHTIDRLRELQADHLIDSHGQPVSGRDEVEEVMRYTRDGIQFIHDQTIRHMNKGLTPDELVHAVQFPPHLAEYSPWLREHYGTVAHSVRQIYQGYLGWFEGDPVDLDPTPRRDKAQRLVELVGGREAVLDAAREAYRDDDPQWAAELATYLIRIDRDDTAARQIKARSFRQLGYAQMNFNWRSWYLMAAQELEGNMPAAEVAEGMREIFSSPALMQHLPVRVWLRGWALRVDPERAADVHSNLGFRFTDIDEGYTMELRRGVVQIHDHLRADTEIALEMTRALLNRLLTSALTLEQAIETGEVSVDGSAEKLAAFAENFDLEQPPIDLTVR